MALGMTCVAHRMTGVAMDGAVGQSPFVMRKGVKGMRVLRMAWSASPARFASRALTFHEGGVLLPYPIWIPTLIGMAGGFWSVVTFEVGSCVF